MRVLFVVHGYPPRETAGTERHAAVLAHGLRARGHDVHIFAATRAPGRPQYSVMSEPGITRIVNNVTARPLGQAERDPSVDAAFRRVQAQFQPDLVHVHHLQFLSSGLPVEAPLIVTLHDQWTWCAAGGTGITAEGTRCSGPSPDRCAPCAAHWAPVLGRTGRTMSAAAGVLAPVVAPERLHRLYQRLPARLRARVHRGRTPSDGPSAAARRNAAMVGFVAGADARISPSRHLADLATAQGVGPVVHVPHGIEADWHGDAGEGTRTDGPFLFLGTVVAHKGPDLVVRAWRQLPAGPGLRVHGSVVDGALLLGHPAGGLLDRAGTRAALDGARALVVGSRWHENAPLVVLEARARGCPVIAPRLGGLPELIEPGVDGWLVPPDDVDALAQAMAEALHTRLVPRPPPTADQMIDRTEAVYRQVLAGRGLP